jgi:hypothetical protein
VAQPRADHHGAHAGQRNAEQRTKLVLVC